MLVQLAMETTEGLAEKAEVPPESQQGWQVELWGNGIEAVSGGLSVWLRPQHAKDGSGPWGK